MSNTKSKADCGLIVADRSDKELYRRSDCTFEKRMPRLFVAW